jgi:hypothetical protein
VEREHSIAAIFDTCAVAGCKTTIETSGPTAQGLAGTPEATDDEGQLSSGRQG